MRQPLFPKPSSEEVSFSPPQFSRFKLKIVRKSPTAEQLVNNENVPNKMALAEGYGQAWDIWSEEGDRKRRMGL